VLDLSYVFIAHDLAVVRYISDRIAVMYLGRIVELGEKAEVCSSPAHPYTQAIFSAAPVPDPTRRGTRERIVPERDAPSPLTRPSGCPFRTRCWKTQDSCRQQEPILRPIRGDAMHAACHFAISEPATRVES
jgi:oligopeptide/dipeptide ABC transporter ATP-binding protein